MVYNLTPRYAKLARRFQLNYLGGMPSPVSCPGKTAYSRTNTSKPSYRIPIIGSGISLISAGAHIVWLRWSCKLRV